MKRQGAIYMWSNYFFYLMELPENERNVQITILVAFWIFMFGVGILVEYIKKLYLKRRN